MTPTSSIAFQARFIELAGHLAELCAFNRSIGQIYGILYITPGPLCLEDVAKACSMSKGNASIHLRTLESWGAVHQTGKPGTRKDYYSANTDIRGLAMKRLQEGVTRRLDHAAEKIKVIKQDPSFSQDLGNPEGAHWKKRIADIDSLIQQIQSGFNLLPKLFKLKKFLPL